MVIFRAAKFFCIIGVAVGASAEEASMDTKYFMQAMEAWEKRTGKKCIMSNVDAATFSELLREAQQLKESDNARKNS